MRPRFRLNEQAGRFIARPQFFYFADDGVRRLAYLRIDPHDIQSTYEVVLKPARSLRVPLEHRIANPTGRITSLWTLEPIADQTDPPGPVSMRYGQTRPLGEQGHRLAVALPEGHYRLSIDTIDPDARRMLEQTNAEITVPAGNGPLILPPLRMRPVYENIRAGHPAPELDAYDPKTEKPVRLADFRGKVVVLTFWGFWFEPCIEAITDLLRLQETFRNQSVAIIALHDQSIQSRVEFDRKLEHARKTAWEGRNLPFTVALDRPNPELSADDSPNGRGISIARYEIPGLPTTLLIDRDGKLVSLLELSDHEQTEAAINNALSRGD